MMTLLHVLHRLLVDPASLGPRPANVTADLAGFTWTVRRRCPSFHALLTGTVELSTEIVAVVVIWGMTAGWHTMGLQDVVLPAWGAIQVLVIAVAVGWQLEGRRRVVRLHVTPHLMRWGARQELPLDHVRDVRATASGRGPLYRAQLIIEHADGTVVIAADGDAASSLKSLAQRIRTGVAEARSSGHASNARGA